MRCLGDLMTFCGLCITNTMDEETKEQYLATLNEKEKVAYRLSTEQLKIRLEDTIGFQKWYRDNINGNQRGNATDAASKTNPA